jgi:hypothetical protein
VFKNNTKPEEVDKMNTREFGVNENLVKLLAEKVKEKVSYKGDFEANLALALRALYEKYPTDGFLSDYSDVEANEHSFKPRGTGKEIIGYEIFVYSAELPEIQLKSHIAYHPRIEIEICSFSGEDFKVFAFLRYSVKPSEAKRSFENWQYNESLGIGVWGIEDGALTKELPDHVGFLCDLLEDELPKLGQKQGIMTRVATSEPGFFTQVWPYLDKNKALLDSGVFLLEGPGLSAQVIGFDYGADNEVNMLLSFEGKELSVRVEDYLQNCLNVKDISPVDKTTLGGLVGKEIGFFRPEKDDLVGLDFTEHYDILAELYKEELSAN